MLRTGPFLKADPFRPNLAVEGEGQGGSTRRAKGVGRQESQHRRVDKKRSTRAGERERVIT